MKGIIVLGLMSLLVSGTSRADGKRHFSIHDLITTNRLGEARSSPDGQWVAYTSKKFDLGTNKYENELWLLSADGKSKRRLISGSANSISSINWSSTSDALAYLTNQSGSTQIWVMSIQTGKAYKISQYPIGVSNLKWSPTNEHFAFSAEVFLDAPDLKATAARDAELKKNPVDAMAFDQLMIRHWDTWSDGKHSHIFTQATSKKGGKWVLVGEPKDIMPNVKGDSPTRPFGGPEDFDWSKDGKEIAYTVHLGRDRAWTTDLNVFAVLLDTLKSDCLTCENKAMDKNPVYSPDGKSIAYLAMKRPGFEADKLEIKIYDRNTSKTKTIYDKWDVSVNSIVWSQDSKSIYVTAQDTAREKIFVLDVFEKNEPRVVVDDHHNVLISEMAPARLLFKQDSMLFPTDLLSVNANGENLKKLTALNEKMSETMLSKPEEFYFEGATKEKVHAWILKPVEFVEGKKYPVAFLIHGGPQGAFIDNYHYRWNPQIYAAAGYAVIMVNFHGSTGFGQAFTDSISNDWGGKPYDDLMMGLDFAIAHYDWLDGSKVCALGASYGGFMINWINGHTDRFKCLVNHDGIFDTFGMYFSTEELWFPEWENGGTPMKDPLSYDKVSPARFVKNWKTPTLVIHGGKDYRVVDVEGISTFTALQRMSIPSKLIYFPGENHWVLNPRNSIFWHEEVLGWLDQWLKN